AGDLLQTITGPNPAELEGARRPDASVPQGQERHDLLLRDSDPRRIQGKPAGRPAARPLRIRRTVAGGFLMPAAKNPDPLLMVRRHRQALRPRKQGLKWAGRV